MNFIDMASAGDSVPDPDALASDRHRPARVERDSGALAANNQQDIAHVQNDGGQESARCLVLEDAEGEVPQRQSNPSASIGRYGAGIGGPSSCC